MIDITHKQISSIGSSSISNNSSFIIVESIYLSYNLEWSSVIQFVVPRGKNIKVLSLYKHDLFKHNTIINNIYYE